jgi:predicted ATPase/transcriptional regulator with XRE-family HTH domain/tetratricopeptide (TPR) repeat protein
MEDLGRPAFGTLLRHFRLGAGLSQEALAERAQMSADTVSALERGARRAPYAQTITLLAHALGLEPHHRARLEAAATRLPQRRRLRAVDPSTEGTLALEPAHDPLAVVAFHSMDSPRHNLPSELSSLLGRAEAIAEIHGLVGDRRLVTLVGAGGVGKTRLALKVAENLLTDWPDGVWLAELAPVTDPTLVLSTVAQAVGLRRSSGDPTIELLASHLTRRRLLLVLDNCEHVIDDVCRLAVAILRECPNVTILATSREPLNVTCEWAYRVRSLSYPERSPANAAEASMYAAITLFAERAQAADDSFRLSDENAAAVAEICRRLDGIPLAIELVAARVKVLAAHQLAQMLDHRLGFLTGSDRTAPPRQQTMRSTIDWSYALLSDLERLLFDRLSIFVGGCTLELVQAICCGGGIDEENIVNTLLSLVDKSLVVADRLGERKRFRLLESSRQFGREKLIERGEQQRLSRRHAEAYLGYAERFPPSAVLLPNGVDAGTIREMRREEGNLNAALAWSLGAGNDVALGQRVACTLAGPIYASRSASPQHWIRVALQQVDGNTPRPLVARLELQLALWQSPLFPRPELALRAMSTCREIGDRAGRWEAQRLAAGALATLGRAAEAERLIRPLLAELRKDGSQQALLHALGMAILVSRAAGDLAEARSLYDEATRGVAKSRGRPAILLAVIHGNMSLAEADLGDLETALSHARQEMAIDSGLIQDSPDWCHSLVSVASILVALDRFEEAHEHARAAFRLGRDVQSEIPTLYPLTLQRLAAVAALRRIRHRPDLREDATRGARILGFADAAIAATAARVRWPIDDREHDRVLAALREVLGADELARLVTEGASMTDEDAAALAESI